MESEIKEKPNIKIGVTHAGSFHADDVFGTALLKMIYPGIQIMRVQEVPKQLIENPQAIIYDIGKGKYDHHNSPELRSNGVEYSSFGKLWRDFGEYVLPSRQSRFYVDSVLVQEIDKTDNGCGSNPLSISIKWFNRSWNEDDSKDDIYFMQAVEMATEILKHVIKRKLSEDEADREILKACQTQRGNILVLDKYLPISPSIRDDIYFVIYPSNRGGFNVSPIIDRKLKKIRYSLPIAEWSLNPPTGFIFSHEKFCNFDTIDNALNAVTDVINKTTGSSNINITQLLDKSDWKIFDGNREINIDAVNVLDNGAVCPCFESRCYTLNPLATGLGNKLYISNKSYGTVIKDSESNRSTSDATRYNDSSQPNQIILRVYKDGTRSVIE